MTAGCSQCGHAMVFDGIADGMRGPAASFHCSNCDQQAHVFQDGTGGMTLATLFPTPSTAQQHHEFAEYQAGEKAMYRSMMVVAGWLSLAEFVEWEQQLAASVEAYKAEHPLPRSMWSRLRR